MYALCATAVEWEHHTLGLLVPLPRVARVCVEGWDGKEGALYRLCHGQENEHWYRRVETKRRDKWMSNRQHGRGERPICQYARLTIL